MGDFRILEVKQSVFADNDKRAAEVRRELKEKKVTGSITKIAQAVIDGTSHYYLMVEGSEDIFDISVVDFIDVVRCEVGQEVAMEYKEDEKANLVMSLEIRGSRADGDGTDQEDE